MVASITTHGQSATVEYKTWNNMWSRCTNPKTEDWDRYGGRGIRVCDRWSVFENFIADMGNRPRRGYSIDRIDTDGHYQPSNCRWADQKTQCRNTSVNHIVEFDGRSMPLAEAVEISGIKYNTVLYRIKRGWPVDRAIRGPIHARR